MRKIESTINAMLRDLVKNPKHAMTSRSWLVKSKGVTFTVSVIRGDLLNG